jgi:drug/metabolite transporter (DMT)-like permease
MVVTCVLSQVKLSFQKAYVKEYGSSARYTCLQSVISSAIFVGMMMLEGSFPKYTHFSFAVAIIFALLNSICMLISFAVLRIGEMSRYSLFLHLGGLIIPFAYGIFFNGDALTVGKIICLVCVLSALFVSIQLKGKTGSIKALLMYLAVFCINGIGCVLLAFHQNNLLGLENVSSDSFTILYMVLYGLMMLILALFLRLKEGKQPPIPKKHLLVLYSGGSGVCYGVGNLLLVICLLHIEPSFQYPIITGGGIILAGIGGLFFGEKITWRFLVSCALVLVGTIALALL